MNKQSLTARQLFKQVYGGHRNFITPKIVRYGKIHPNIAYEISTGIGIRRQPIFGLTVVANVNGPQVLHSLCNCFPSLDDVERRIINLQTQLENPQTLRHILEENQSQTV